MFWGRIPTHSDVSFSPVRDFKLSKSFFILNNRQHPDPESHYPHKFDCDRISHPHSEVVWMDSNHIPWRCCKCYCVFVIDIQRYTIYSGIFFSMLCFTSNPYCIFYCGDVFKEMRQTSFISILRHLITRIQSVLANHSMFTQPLCTFCFVSKAFLIIFYLC